MYCPNCGKQIAEQSTFCAYCGKPISSVNRASIPSVQWEYKERHIDMKNKDGSYVWFDSSDSIARDLLNAWTGGWENAVRSYLNDDFAQGWEIDPTAWGASCLQYEAKGLGPAGWHLGYWIAYILLSMITAFIGLFILPFIMKRSVIVIHGANVRLRRLKQN